MSGMEVIARGKTPEGYKLSIIDWHWPYTSNLPNFEVVAYTPSNGHSGKTFGPRFGEVYRFPFSVRTLEEAKSIFDNFKSGTPISDYKHAYSGDYPDCL